jgi:hypothetical protein
MSDLRIALVAEGPTDYVVIEAALKSVLAKPFTMVLLQPEATQGIMGTGWCGVIKWCQAAPQRHQLHHGSLDTDPTLVGFDLIIIHLDVDVASKQYGDCGGALPAIAQDSNWGSLLHKIDIKRTRLTSRTLKTYFLCLRRESAPSTQQALIQD